MEQCQCQFVYHFIPPLLLAEKFNLSTLGSFKAIHSSQVEPSKSLWHSDKCWVLHHSFHFEQSHKLARNQPQTLMTQFDQINLSYSQRSLLSFSPKSLYYHLCFRCVLFQNQNLVLQSLKFAQRALQTLFQEYLRLVPQRQWVPLLSFLFHPLRQFKELHQFDYPYRHRSLPFYLQTMEPVVQSFHQFFEQKHHLKKE